MATAPTETRATDAIDAPARRRRRMRSGGSVRRRPSPSRCRRRATCRRHRGVREVRFIGSFIPVPQFLNRPRSRSSAPTTVISRCHTGAHHARPSVPLTDRRRTSHHHGAPPGGQSHHRSQRAISFGDVASVSDRRTHPVERGVIATQPQRPSPPPMAGGVHHHPRMYAGQVVDRTRAPSSAATADRLGDQFLGRVGAPRSAGGRCVAPSGSDNPDDVDELGVCVDQQRRSLVHTRIRASRSPERLPGCHVSNRTAARYRRCRGPT